MTPSFGNSIHLVSGDSAAGHVKHAAALAGTTKAQRRIVCSSDLLTIGPCDVDPERHLELRRAYHTGDWPTAFGLDDLRAATAGDLPVVLWGTRAFADLLWLWWALDGLGRIWIDRQRLFLARPRVDHPLQTVGGTPPEEAGPALAAATAVSDELLDEGAELWRRYASPSPLAFDEARRAGSTMFPELTDSAELHGAWFPRLVDGRLRLAELDALLLGALDDTWRMTHEILLAMPDRERLMWIFGTFTAITRLRAWATHGAIAHEARSDMNPFRQDAFRPTDHTRRLLEHGLDSVADAPPLHVGGCRVNDPAAPWAHVPDGTGWRLALVGTTIAG